MELVNQKEYIMYSTAYKEDKLLNFYKGIFQGLYYNDKLIFEDVVEIKSVPGEFLGHSGRFTSRLRRDLLFLPKKLYTFHDIEQVKENGQKAIQNMEKRALDMILKRLVNEQFEWL